MGYENVKEWRKRTKERAVASLGGKCVCCQYVRCTSALELHHLDPSQKEFNLSRSIAAWDKIIVEIRKCVLVCCRCHREIHAGVLTVPSDAKRFDESFAKYKAEKAIDKCPVCSKTKYSSSKTCSFGCANELRSINNRKRMPPKIDLEKMILEKRQWKEIAKKYGVTDSTPKKWADIYGIRYERRRLPKGQQISKEEANRRKREKRALQKLKIAVSSNW